MWDPHVHVILVKYSSQRWIPHGSKNLCSYVTFLSRRVFFRPLFHLFQAVLTEQDVEHSIRNVGVYTNFLCTCSA